MTIKHNQSCIWCTTSINILAYCYYSFYFHSQTFTSYFVVILNNLCNNQTIMNARGSFTGDRVIKPWTGLPFSCSVEVENAGSSTSICHCKTVSCNLCYILLLEVIYVRACGGAVDQGTAIQAGGTWVQFPIMLLELFLAIILLAIWWTGGQLSL